MARRSRLMSEIEEKHQRPLELLLPEKLTELGLTATAEELG